MNGNGAHPENDEDDQLPPAHIAQTVATQRPNVYTLVLPMGSIDIVPRRRSEPLHHVARSAEEGGGKYVESDVQHAVSLLRPAARVPAHRHETVFSLEVGRQTPNRNGQVQHENESHEQDT